jgi:2-aminoadipate transaminase
MAIHHFAQRMQRVQPSAVAELLRLGSDPSVISFGGGYPDATLFPLEQLDDVFHRTISVDGARALQYSVSDGLPALRALIARRMQAMGAPTAADDVLVLQGAQQGLDLVAKLLIDPGDVIVTENPTFVGALLAFDPYEPRYVGVPVDQDGMDMAALEQVLQSTPRVKLIYTVPDFHNPTGVTMSRERRSALIELANRYDVLILEDTPYREVRFEGEHLPTLRSLDSAGRVIFLGSFSKILAPGLRLGWAAAAPDLLQKLGMLKLAADTQTSTVNMLAVTAFLERYDIDAHIDRLRAAYRRKKDLMLDLIRETFPADVQVTNPQGGLFTWVTFRPDFDTTAFMRDYGLPQARVAYVPGATFFPVVQEQHHARFNYSYQSDEQIIAGMTALGRLLHQQLG